MPAGPVNTIDEVFADPQVAPPRAGAAGRTHPRLGELSIIRNAVHDDRHRAPTVRDRGPDAGEHTDEVLASGLSPRRIADLRDATSSEVARGSDADRTVTGTTSRPPVVTAVACSRIAA